MKKLLWVIVSLAVLATLAIAATPLAIGPLSSKFNPVVTTGPYEPVAADIAQLHQSLSIVDLHADPLLWGRDLLKRSNYGQVDLPRLKAGNMALQVFGVVTQSPKGQNFDNNSADTDRLKPLVIAQRWPVAAWNSYFERAIFQAKRLDGLVADSGGQLQWVRNQQELSALLAKRQAGDKVVGGLLGLEGTHALEGDSANVQKLFDAGFRMMGMAHFIDNKMAGSAHGVERGGLSEEGRAAIEKAQSLGMVIDLAHSAPPVVVEVLKSSRKPVVFSHTGVQATCAGPRNLSDEMLLLLKANGGVAGIAQFKGAVCEPTFEATAKAIVHAVKVAGVDHVALGADMDGGVTVPMDISGAAYLTAELKKAGLSDADIRKVSGENALRVFREVLP